MYESVLQPSFTHSYSPELSDESLLLLTYVLYSHGYPRAVLVTTRHNNAESAMLCHQIHATPSSTSSPLFVTDPLSIFTLLSHTGGRSAKIIRPGH